MGETKHEKVQALRDKIGETHAMKSGQAYSWEACGVSGTDECEICGLKHHWGRRGQNTGSSDSYEDAKGNTLTLAEAARLECE